MVLNYASIAYIHSGMGPDTMGIVALHRLRQANKKLALCGFRQNLLEFIKLMQLHTIFTIFAHESEAIDFVLGKA